MEFYKILQNIMNKKDLSIPEVSRRTGIADSTIRSIISRKTKNISLDVAFKLSNGLDVTLEELNGEAKDFNSTATKINVTNEVNSMPFNIKEKKLLKSFYQLNDMGKEKAIDNIQDLTQIDKYIINNNKINEVKEKDEKQDKIKKFNLKEELEKLDPIETVAAHNDHWDEPGEMEKMKQDLDEMDKWEW
ncbi:helix-turn-helix domain-containing protein [Metaclostridioides mangenotii]|uniref:helix-turn-helix domain-containing protein n=1 Tax=Metaclostridioides mangenotii TaxID=1540 RepID=UPI0026E92A5F|nr:helix-turn-helix transcriptional regulator [Clostridioides mangenotii]